MFSGGRLLLCFCLPTKTWHNQLSADPGPVVFSLSSPESWEVLDGGWCRWSWGELSLSFRFSRLSSLFFVFLRPSLFSVVFLSFSSDEARWRISLPSPLETSRKHTEILPTAFLPGNALSWSFQVTVNGLPLERYQVLLRSLFFLLKPSSNRGKPSQKENAFSPLWLTPFNFLRE